MAKKIVPQENNLFDFTDDTTVDDERPPVQDPELLRLVREFDDAMDDDGENATTASALRVMKADAAIRAYHRKKLGDPDE